MHHWTKRLFAIAAPLLLTGCLWGPGKFNSNLTLSRNGSFVLDYRGEIVMQLPPDDAKADPWKDEMARCHKSGTSEIVSPPVTGGESDDDPVRPCTAAELAKLKAQHEQE